MSRHRKNKTTEEKNAAVLSCEAQAETESGTLHPTSSLVTSIRVLSSKVTPIRAASNQSVLHASASGHVEELVRQRAYELYEKRGREHGHAEEDWLHAEAEVLGAVLRKASVG